MGMIPSLSFLSHEKNGLYISWRRICQSPNTGDDLSHLVREMTSLKKDYLSISWKDYINILRGGWPLYLMRKLTSLSDKKDDPSCNGPRVDGCLDSVPCCSNQNTCVREGESILHRRLPPLPTLNSTLLYSSAIIRSRHQESEHIILKIIVLVPIPSPVSLYTLYSMYNVVALFV